MSDDLLEWARKQYENWLFNAITTEAGIKSLLPKQGEQIDIPMLPEPAPKYDGNLDRDGDAKVQYGAAYPGESGIYVIDTTGDDAVYLSAEQALSLLAWLKQNEPELRRLVEGQALRDTNTKAGEG